MGSIKMPRKSTIMQMDLQREFASTITTLREIWDELGIPDEQIETRGNAVRMHIRNLLAGMVDEEIRLKETMLQCIDDYREKITDLCYKLSLPQFSMEGSEMTIMEREKSLRNQLNQLKTVKSQRLRDLDDLKTVEKQLCDQLCATPCCIPNDAIPSEKQLEEMRERVMSLKEEKRYRLEEFNAKKSTILALYDELELLPETVFAQDLINDVDDSISLSTSSMANLATLHKQLMKKRDDRQLVVERLWSQVESLWVRLEVDGMERKMIKNAYQGLKCHVVDGLTKVLSDLQILKHSNLKKLTERCRSEISVLWDKCYYSKEQRNQFAPAYDENYTDDLLYQHDEELARLHACYEEHKVMFADVKKWQSLFHRMSELESKATDVNRFTNRGGNLLKEEKERKRIHKQLPKVEKELFQAIYKNRLSGLCTLPVAGIS